MMEHDSALAKCLEWTRDHDFGFPVPRELLRKLRANYGVEVRSFLEVLEGASEAERKAFYPLLFETLYVMAERDDGEAIRKVFALCPGLCRDGYYSYDQTLPLGEAIEYGACCAIEAFLEAGCSLETVSWAGYSALEYALQCDCGEEMLLFLLDRVGEVTFSELALAWEEDPELAKRLIAHARCLPRTVGEEERQQYPELADFLECL